MYVCVGTTMQGAVEYQNMHRDGGIEIKTADGSLPSIVCTGAR